LIQLFCGCHSMRSPRWRRADSCLSVGEPLVGEGRKCQRNGQAVFVDKIFSSKRRMTLTTPLLSSTLSILMSSCTSYERQEFHCPSILPSSAYSHSCPIVSTNQRVVCHLGVQARHELHIALAQLTQVGDLFDALVKDGRVPREHS
jgi:hypothetical protein